MSISLAIALYAVVREVSSARRAAETARREYIEVIVWLIDDLLKKGDAALAEAKPEEWIKNSGDAKSTFELMAKAGAPSDPKLVQLISNPPDTNRQLVFSDQASASSYVQEQLTKWRAYRYAIKERLADT